MKLISTGLVLSILLWVGTDATTAVARGKEGGGRQSANSSFQYAGQETKGFSKALGGDGVGTITGVASATDVLFAEAEDVGCCVIHIHALPPSWQYINNATRSYCQQETARYQNVPSDFYANTDCSKVRR